jgi:hypothetical protein
VAAAIAATAPLSGAAPPRRKVNNAMAFVPVPNTLQAELRFAYGTQLAENVLYFVGSAGVTPALATSLGTALVTWWNANFKADSVTNFILSSIYMTDLTSQTSFTVTHTTGLPSPGTNGGDPIPFNCALVASFRTAQRGRSGRGRNYVGGWPETQVSSSTPDAARVGRILTGYNLLIGAGTFVAGLQWVVVSRFTNNAPRAVGLAIPITSVIVDSIMDSQRRRLPGRGR